MSVTPRKLLVVSVSDRLGYLKFVAVDGQTVVVHEKSLAEMAEFAGAVQQATILACEKMGQHQLASDLVELFANNAELPENVVLMRKEA